jgi:hypothetical protein
LAKADAAAEEAETKTGRTTVPRDENEPEENGQ